MNDVDRTTSDYGSTVIGALRCIGFLTLIAVMLPVHLLYLVLKPNDRYSLPLRFHQKLIRLLGFKVCTHGTISEKQPTLFVCNHVSYLDIPVLGSLIPGSFVAKAEVAGWPIFGLMAKLQHTVFIERRAQRAAEQRNVLGEHLAAGYNLILFPEGTSSDGQMVLPFKSTLFSVIETANADIDIWIQPVSIGCTGVDGLPMIQGLRHLYGWYGDLELVPHLWQAFKCGQFMVDVVFHAPIRARDLRDRKKLAAACHAAVSSGLENCITGRWAKTDSRELIAGPAH